MAEFRTVQEKDDRIRELSARCSDLVAENESLRKENGLVPDSVEKVARAEAEVAELRAELVEAHRQADQLRIQNKSLTAALAKSEAERDDAVARMKSLAYGFSVAG